MSAKQRELWSKQPRLIQRCLLDKADKKIKYEYMGSSEYECGDQAKSLKMIFEGEVEVRKCSIRAFDRDVEFYLVARSDFDFNSYPTIIDGLIKLEWGTKQQTYLDLVLQKKFRLVKAKDYDFVKTQAWFDFVNGVFFALSKKDADFLVVAMGEIKEIWRQKEVWRNSPPVKKFLKELGKVKKLLEKARKDWIALDTIEECEGGIKVWLNPRGNNYYAGWFTLQDLRDWVKEKGPVVAQESVNKEG